MRTVIKDGKEYINRDDLVNVLAHALDEKEAYGDDKAIQATRDIIRWCDAEIAVNEVRDGGEVEG